MSMVDTWSIWMATLSFMGRDSYVQEQVPRLRFAPLGMKSVKPATQFLQQGRRTLAQSGIAGRALDMEKSLEGGDRGAALVQARVELSRLEQQFRPVRRDRQHALERLRRTCPILALGEPQ